MFTSILSFLIDRVPDPLLNLYTEAAKIIGYYNDDDQYELLDEMMTHEDMDVLATLDMIHEFHITQLTNIILNYGITIQDISFKDRIQLITSLMILEEHEDAATIKEMIEQSEDTRYTLVSLLAFADAYDEIYYDTLIDKVEPLLLTRLYQVMSDRNVSEIVDTPAIDPNKIKILKSLKDHPGYQPSVVYKYIQRNLGLGLELPLYLNLLKEDIFHEDASIDGVATDLYLLSLITSTKDTNACYSSILTDYTDITTATQIIAAIRKHPLKKEGVV